MVIHVVKAVFLPGLTEGLNPANAGVTGLSGVSPLPAPDTATAHPKQAHYQLRRHLITEEQTAQTYSPKKRNGDTPGTTQTESFHTRGKTPPAFV